MTVKPCWEDEDTYAKYLDLSNEDKALQHSAKL